MNSDFEKEKSAYINELKNDKALKELSNRWIAEASRHKYSYNFSWLGRPIIQFPQDIVAMQEIIWNVQPDFIIETGIAHGGSLIFYASMLELLGNNGTVLGIDIDIRNHNRIEIERHKFYKRIIMIEGSSIDETIAKQVYNLAKGKKKILLVLDSNHTHEHVFKELELYSGLVKKGSYLVVFDTIIEDMPKGYFSDRPWDKGNNPKTAVEEFIKKNDRFQVDTDMEAKLQITVGPGGFLKCVKD
ncbi:MAG TPA: cephalosporin hydroxylase family protein [Chitinivibrionales bacterium]|nr:cephalosporin hydroxylase family protein [Chitinivibrionales bacterium]